MAARARTRRLVDVVLGMALALAVLAPLIFGPALVPLTRALGGMDSHVCACGMPRGTCGCPECERLERERLREHAPRPYPVLKAQCGGDGASPAYASLPPTIPPATRAFLPEAPRALLALPRPAEGFSRDLAEPATPPPRRIAA